MEIVRTKRYRKDLKKMGVPAQDVEALELEIATNPEKGDIIQGLKGVRKIRFKINNRSKASGGRAIYYVIVQEEVALMITAYAKSEKDDLSDDDRTAILEVLEELGND